MSFVQNQNIFSKDKYNHTYKAGLKWFLTILFLEVITQIFVG